MTTYFLTTYFLLYDLLICRTYSTYYLRALKDYQSQFLKNGWSNTYFLGSES